MLMYISNFAVLLCTFKQLSLNHFISLKLHQVLLKSKWEMKTWDLKDAWTTTALGLLINPIAIRFVTVEATGTYGIDRDVCQILYLGYSGFKR